MKTMLLTWLTSGTFLGAAIGLIVYIMSRDAAKATLVGVFGGFITGAAAAVLSGYVDQKIRETDSPPDGSEADQ